MKRSLMLLTVVLSLAWIAIATPLNDRDRHFHPDEAFFMTFARHAAIGGDWWLQGALDKPPLTLYAHAIMISFVGAETLPDGVLTLAPSRGEFVGRLFSVFCGLTMIALTMRLTLDISRRVWSAVIVGVVLATLPMIQLYSASAFMDMPLLALSLGSLLAARRGRGAASGALLALALATKPQALLLLPLAAWFVLRSRRGRWVAFGLALGVGMSLLLLWDIARPGNSVFALGAVNNSSLLPSVDLSVLVQRLSHWLPAGNQTLLPTSGLVVLLSAMLLAGLIRRPTRALSLWVLVYISGHLILFATPYQRYWLPVIPLLVMGTVGAITAWITPKPAGLRWQRVRLLALGLLVSSLLGWLYLTTPTDDSVSAASRACPRGQLADDTRWQYSSIPDLAAKINDLPTATVVYDHWLGWLLRYYMGEWQDKRLVYYPSPAALVAGIRALKETEPRYFIVPHADTQIDGLSSAWSGTTQPWLDALIAAGVSFSQEDTGAMPYDLYRINP